MVKNGRNKGITLIALIVTIVVLLILAGVTINAITGSENAMEKATEAREKNEQGAELEAIKMAVVNSVASGLDGLVDTTSLKNELNGLVEEQGRQAIDDSKSSWEVIGKETKIKYEINKNGNVIVKSGITLSTTKIEFSEDITTYTLEATLSNDLNGTINWSIPENNGVASINTTEGNSIIVSKTGDKGNTTITASLNGTSYPVTCIVTINTPPQVGDFVNYSAGKWTLLDIEKLEATLNEEKTEITDNGNYYTGGPFPTSSTKLKFGGFKVGTLTDAEISAGITNSKDISITPYSTYVNTYSGWRILETETKNGITYIKRIIHAGTPEGFFHPNSDVNTSVTMLTNRDWSMYVNPTYYGKSATNVSYNDMYNLTKSESSTDNTLRKTGSYYWLSRASSSNYMYCIYNNGSVNVERNICYGIRPVVTLENEIKGINPTTQEDGTTKWELSK